MSYYIRCKQCRELVEVLRKDQKFCCNKCRIEYIKKPERALMFYKDYQNGLTMTEVSKKYNISDSTLSEIFSRYGFETRKRKTLDTQVFNNHKYSLQPNGYYRRTDIARTLMHRDVWEFYNGTVPVGFEIHHVDHDRNNNNVENLQCLSSHEHSSYHAKQDNNACSKSRAKPIINIRTGEVFKSATEVSARFGITNAYVFRCIRLNKKLKGDFWKWLDEVGTIKDS